MSIKIAYTTEALLKETAPQEYAELTAGCREIIDLDDFTHARLFCDGDEKETLEINDNLFTRISEYSKHGYIQLVLH